MRVIILARNKDQANAYAALGNLRPADVVIASGPASLIGLRLDETDLIAEFPDFDKRANADKIKAQLRHVMTKNEGQPLWKVIGKP